LTPRAWFAGRIVRPTNYMDALLYDSRLWPHASAEMPAVRMRLEDQHRWSLGAIEVDIKSHGRGVDVSLPARETVFANPPTIKQILSNYLHSMNLWSPSKLSISRSLALAIASGFVRLWVEDKKKTKRGIALREHHEKILDSSACLKSVHTGTRNRPGLVRKGAEAWAQGWSNPNSERQAAFGWTSHEAPDANGNLESCRLRTVGS